MNTRADLALRVRELQTNVEHLSGELRKTRSWLGRGIVAGLIIVAGLVGGLWWVNQRAVKTESQVAELQTKFDRQRDFALAMSEAFKQQAELENLRLPDDEKLNRALATAAQREKLSAADYLAAINEFIDAVRANPTADSSDQMLADFAQRKSFEAVAATVAAQIQPSGTLMVSGTPRLMIGNRPFEVGTRFAATYNQQNYELELAAIGETTFTLRYRGEEITRQIKPIQ